MSTVRPSAVSRGSTVDQLRSAVASTPEVLSHHRETFRHVGSRHQDHVEELGIDWNSSPFDLEQFRQGIDVELEHGTRDPETNVTDDDPLTTGKIALAHLRELPDYYTRLERMEAE